MKRRGAMRRLFLSMATLAVLAGALAPAISQALQRSAALGWTFVCTQLGSKWIRADEPGPGSRTPAPHDAHLFEHCPYCSLHAASLGMPPSPVALPMLVVSHAAHSRYIAATPTLDFWSDALSRGPPRPA